MASSLLNRVKDAIFKSSASEPLLNAAANASSLLPSNLTGKSWRTVKLQVDSDWSNVRLDRLLTKKFDISPSFAQKLIRQQKVWIERAGGKAEAERIGARAGLRVAAGDSVNLAEVFLPEKKPKQSATVSDQELLQSWSLFEDSQLLVLNKPSGWAMHSGP